MHRKQQKSSKKTVGQGRYAAIMSLARLPTNWLLGRSVQLLNKCFLEEEI